MDAAQLRVDIQARLDAGDSDGDVLTWLKADVDVLGIISTKRMLGWAAAPDLLRSLDDVAADAAAVDAKRGIARTTAQLIRSQSDLDVGDTETQALLETAVTLGVISQANRDDLETRATTTQPRYESLGYKRMGDTSWLHWIAQARAI